MQFQEAGIAIALRRTDPHQWLAGQPAGRVSGAEPAPFEGFESCVAKDRANDGAVAQPQFFGSGLIPARRAWGDGAHLVRRAKVASQRRQDCAESRRVDTVPRPFELNPLEAMRRLVHLEKHHHRNPADDLARQDDIYIAVAKVERSSQPCRLSAELPDQFIREFAPMSSVPNLANSGRSKGGSGIRGGCKCDCKA